MKEKELIVLDGLLEAEIIKSKLESFDIPCFLKFDSATRLYGITIDGLGKVKVIVPEELYDQAREIIAPVEEKE